MDIVVVQEVDNSQTNTKIDWLILFLSTIHFVVRFNYMPFNIISQTSRHKVKRLGVERPLLIEFIFECGELNVGRKKKLCTMEKCYHTVTGPY